MTKALNDVLADPEKFSSLISRYWAKVDVAGEDECWIWNSKSKHPFGYGRMTAGRGVNLKAHQIGWALENGPIPDGMNILHGCDNPSCSNPKHLFIGTQMLNMHDKIAKGRSGSQKWNSGESHQSAKFSDVQMWMIGHDTRAAKSVADEWGTSDKTVYLYRKGLRS